MKSRKKRRKEKWKVGTKAKKDENKKKKGGSKQEGKDES